MEQTTQKFIALSFKQLINLTKKNYFSGNDEKKEEIANNFICDPQVSLDVLNRYYDMYKTKRYEDSIIYDSLENYYEHCNILYLLMKIKNFLN